MYKLYLTRVFPYRVNIAPRSDESSSIWCTEKVYTSVTIHMTIMMIQEPSCTCMYTGMTIQEHQWEFLSMPRRLVTSS